MQVSWLAKHMTRKAVSDLMQIDWKTVGRCVTRTLKHLDPETEQRRLTGLVRIGVDETSFRKGHKYMTVVINHDTGEVVWVHDGHGKAVFDLFFKALTKEQRRTIELVSGDGAKWIDSCIKEHIPHARRCIGPFHVVQWAGKSLDNVRTRIWQLMRGDDKNLTRQIKECKDEKERKRLEQARKEQEALTRSIKGSAYALGKAPENLTEPQQAKLQLIAQTQPVLMRAYRLKEELGLILKMPAEAAQDSLKRWYWRASHSRIEEIKELARKIKRHAENIFNTMRYGLSNARNEAANNKIKVLLRRSYGFRNLESMCSFVSLMCSNLQIPLPNRPRNLYHAQG